MIVAVGAEVHNNLLIWYLDPLGIIAGPCIEVLSRSQVP